MQQIKDKPVQQALNYRSMHVLSLHDERPEEIPESETQDHESSNSCSVSPKIAEIGPCQDCHDTIRRAFVEFVQPFTKAFLRVSVRIKYFVIWRYCLISEFLNEFQRFLIGTEAVYNDLFVNQQIHIFLIRDKMIQYEDILADGGVEWIMALLQGHYVSAKTFTSFFHHKIWEVQARLQTLQAWNIIFQAREATQEIRGI